MMRKLAASRKSKSHNR